MTSVNSLLIEKPLVSGLNNSGYARICIPVANITSGDLSFGLSAVTVNTAGSFTVVPSISATIGSGATFSTQMGALTTTVATAQSGPASYVPGDILTAVGGTGTATTYDVATTQVVTASVAAGGTGGTPGTQTVTGTTGTGTKFQASVTVSGGGAITAVLSITVAGSYTVNPTSLTNEPVTGASLSGAQLSITMGVLTTTYGTAGFYTVLPTNPITTTGGSGSGAQFNNTAYFIQHISVTAAGIGYDSSTVLSTTPSGGAVLTPVLSGSGSFAIAFSQALSTTNYTVNLSLSSGLGTLSWNSKTVNGFNISGNNLYEQEIPDDATIDIVIRYVQ